MNQEDRREIIDQKPWKFGLLLVAGLLLLVWFLKTPAGILGKADAIGYAVCHRIDSRSFHLGERQFPLCVRCSGQYIGALFGMIYLGITSRRKAGAPPWSIVIVLFIFVITYAIDGLNSYLHLSPMMEMFPSLPRLYTPSNIIRLLTGSGMGFSIGVVLFLTLNRTVWSKYDKRPVMMDLRYLGLGLLLLLFIDLLVLTENPLILYPLAIVSAFSVVLLLSLIYSLIVILIFHLENRFSSITQVGFPVIIGFIVAIMQLVLLDALRYIVTGTWEGFQL